MMKQLRCAIYTRKSSEEGLEQDFNSLHAQREAAEAFVLSQRHEGWQVIKADYNDGGYSGGSMNRPALQRLLQDIGEGKVDVVVVYKVDRLSRSLHDFAKMVEVFDRHTVSFVSVTQQFNTTSSMGRLTLNVLLSFAQFEREVTGERIRDKIAASKKKGMWMGGHPPLGYDIVEKRLIVNNEETEIARHIFRSYLRLGSVRSLWAELMRQGIYNKPRMREGALKPAVAFSRGGLYYLLSNPIYVGKVRHKQKIFDGEHEAIIDQALWDEVQQQLKMHGPELRDHKRLTEPSLLSGKLFDASGEPLSPSHAAKHGKRYRYYVSRALLVDGPSQEHRGWRVPAYEMEKLVLHAASKVLSDRLRLAKILQEMGLGAQHIPGLLAVAENISKQIDQRHQITQLVDTLIQRIELSKDRIRLQLNLATGDVSAAIKADMPMQIQRRGVELRMIIGNSTGTPDPALIKAVARARAWFEELATGRTASIGEIVKREGLDQGYVSRLLRLAFLPPKVVEAIVAGSQPTDWTMHTLLKKSPHDWVWVS